jgi:hypothetical protein
MHAGPSKTSSKSKFRPNEYPFFERAMRVGV